MPQYAFVGVGVGGESGNGSVERPSQQYLSSLFKVDSSPPRIWPPSQEQDCASGASGTPLT